MGAPFDAGASQTRGNWVEVEVVPALRARVGGPGVPGVPGRVWQVRGGDQALLPSLFQDWRKERESGK